MTDPRVVLIESTDRGRTWTPKRGLTDKESALAAARGDAHTRILPIDFDRSAASDTGYSGWVQFEDGEIYIVDDAPEGTNPGILPSYERLHPRRNRLKR